MMLRKVQALETPGQILAVATRRRSTTANCVHVSYSSNPQIHHRPLVGGGLSPHKLHFYSCDASRINLSLSGWNLRQWRTWRSHNFYTTNLVVSSELPALCRGTDLVPDLQRRKKQQFQFNWIRCFSSKNPSTDDSIRQPEDQSQPPVSAALADNSSLPLSDKSTASQQQPMDPTFAKYLSGEMKPPKELDLQSPVKDDEINAAMNRKRRQRMVAADKNTMDRFRTITEMQALRKEESRSKTAQNVHRALMGNVLICTAKLGAWVSSGSSAMLAEFIHSIVDCGNQSLLLIGLRDSQMAADRKHPYGYGKSIYFWALVSALGTFFLGAGVSMTHAIGDLMEPSLHNITWEVWAVLLLSISVDGYVLKQTIAETMEQRPKGVSYLNHLRTLRDPAILAVLLEDGAACLGIVFAIAGIVASHVSGNPIFDGIAGFGISALLGGMGIALVRVNHRFLLGSAIDPEIVEDIGKILLSRRSIDSIRSIQSQWTGPDTFSYKAEVDFDGTYLAAKLMPIYQEEFILIKDSMDEELNVLLALYAEDVMRAVEREVRHVEAQIRQKYPGAEFIELEPMSKDVDRLAIDDNLEAELRRVESDALNRYLKSLKKESASANERENETKQQ